MTAYTRVNENVVVLAKIESLDSILRNPSVFGDKNAYGHVPGINPHDILFARKEVYVGKDLAVAEYMYCPGQNDGQWSFVAIREIDFDNPRSTPMVGHGEGLVNLAEMHFLNFVAERKHVQRNQPDNVVELGTLGETASFPAFYQLEAFHGMDFLISHFAMEGTNPVNRYYAPHVNGQSVWTQSMRGTEVSFGNRAFVRKDKRLAKQKPESPSHLQKARAFKKLRRSIRFSNMRHWGGIK